MSGHIIATINLSLELVALLVGASMLFGAFDIIRQPGRVWHQAEESKPAYLILVLLLPIIGLALYAFMARPKLVALAAAGPTSPQPSDPPNADVDEIHHQPDRATTTPAPLGSDSPAEMVGLSEEPVVDEATPSAQAGQSGPVEISSTFFSNKGSRMARPRLGLTLSHRPKQRTRPAVEDNIEDVEQVEQVEDNVEADEVPTTFSTKGSRPARSRLSRILSYRLTGRRKQGASPAVEDNVEDVEQVEDKFAADEVPTAPAGWKTDPSGRHQIRYWDGSHWTEHVADADHQATDDQPSDDQTSDDETEESAGSRPRARSRRLAVPYRR